MDLAIARRGPRTLLGHLQAAPIDPPDDPAIDLASTDWRNRDLLLPLIAYGEPVWRRHQIYGWALHTLCEREPTPVLLAEYAEFREQLRRFIFSKRLGGPESLVVRQNGHLRWYGPPPRRGEPSINALGMTYTPVYRLLHAWLCPDQEPQSAHKRPIRNRVICPEDEEDLLHPCVDPRHFRLWDERRLVPTFPLTTKTGRVAHNWRRSGLPSDIVGWHDTCPDGLLHCNPHHHVLSDRYQNDRGLRRSQSVYCAGCHKYRLEERRNPAFRARSAPPSQAARDFAAEIEAQVEAREQNWDDFKI